MKQKKKVILLRRMLSFVLVMCLEIAMSMTVFATSDATPAVADARDGVLQVRLVYVDQYGEEHPLIGGSGFLLGAASGATTIITNYHVVFLDNEQKEKCSEIYGVDFFDANSVNLKIKVVVKRDVVIDASYVNGSEQTDFAILELSQAIYDRSPLKVADSDDVVETQNIYALGFPGATSLGDVDRVYTSSDVTITNGIVGKFQAISNINFILHNAVLGEGNSGGPLIDSNGNVVGVNTMYNDTDSASTYYYSIAINEVTEVLDALGVVYEKADEAAPALEPTPDTTSEPAPGPTSEPIPVPTSEPTPIPEPEPAPANTTLIIAIAAIVVVVLVIVIAVVVIISSTKKKKSIPANRMVSNIPNGAVPPQAPSQQTARPTPPPFTPAPTPFDSGAGETSVLGVGAGETSVLGGGSSQPSATLIRRKNGETVTISKPGFSIGKERSKVDFCVPDNNSISRNHASIVYKGGVYYIVDNNSTNFTYVNGNKITARQEVRLNSGDKIKLADEEFEFRQ